jgi:predicted RNA methylase
MNTCKDLSDLGELYHDFRLFGARNRQIPGIYAPNQRCKAPTIIAYIQLAIAKSRAAMDERVTFTELFCADGYYAMVARLLGADESYGVDSNRDGFLSNAQVIADRLGLTSVHFVRDDVGRVDLLPRTDIVANLGGLYHVSDPTEILSKSYAMARKFLIVQTVYSLVSDSPDYFESPAPGWTWGCRFSRQWLAAQIADLGYDVVDSHHNELEGNERLEDRGSAYYLVAKSAERPPD